MKWSDDFGFLLNKSARLCKLEINTKLKELNVTLPQWVVLNYLYENEQNENNNSIHSPASIAHKVRYDRPTMTGIIDRLVKQGWVSRIMNPADRRSQTITLTEKSRVFIDQMNNLCESINDRILKDFTGSEIMNLREYLLRIIQNLDKGENSFGPDLLALQNLKSGSMK